MIKWIKLLCIPPSSYLLVLGVSDQQDGENEDLKSTNHHNHKNLDILIPHPSKISNLPLTLTHQCYFTLLFNVLPSNDGNTPAHYILFYGATMPPPPIVFSTTMCQMIKYPSPNFLAKGYRLIYYHIHTSLYLHKYHL